MEVKVLGRKIEVIACWGILLACLAFVESIEAKKAYVVKIIDGDSLQVTLGGGKTDEFRLYGIDAPEYGQPYGNSAKRLLSKTILGKTVDYETVTRDKYGRHIVIVKSNGKTINEQLVRNGYAWVYPRYCKRKVCKKWKNLQKKARSKKYGLWKGKDQISPWDWRYK